MSKDSPKDWKGTDQYSLELLCQLALDFRENVGDQVKLSKELVAITEIVIQEKLSSLAIIPAVQLDHSYASAVKHPRPANQSSQSEKLQVEIPEVVKEDQGPNQNEVLIGFTKDGNPLTIPGSPLPSNQSNQVQQFCYETVDAIRSGVDKISIECRGPPLPVELGYQAEEWIASEQDRSDGCEATCGYDTFAPSSDQILKMAREAPPLPHNTNISAEDWIRSEDDPSDAHDVTGGEDLFVESTGLTNVTEKTKRPVKGKRKTMEELTDKQRQLLGIDENTDPEKADESIKTFMEAGLKSIFGIRANCTRAIAHFQEGSLILSDMITDLSVAREDPRKFQDTTFKRWLARNATSGRFYDRRYKSENLKDADIVLKQQVYLVDRPWDVVSKLDLPPYDLGLKMWIDVTRRILRLVGGSFMTALIAQVRPELKHGPCENFNNGKKCKESCNKTHCCHVCLLTLKEVRHDHPTGILCPVMNVRDAWFSSDQARKTPTILSYDQMSEIFKDPIDYGFIRRAAKAALPNCQPGDKPDTLAYDDEEDENDWTLDELDKDNNRLFKSFRQPTPLERRQCLMLMQEVDRKIESQTLQWWSNLHFKTNSKEKLAKARIAYIHKCLDAEDKPTREQLQKDTLRGLNDVLGKSIDNLSPEEVFGEDAFMLGYAPDTKAHQELLECSEDWPETENPASLQTKSEHVEYRSRDAVNWDEAEMDEDRYLLHRKIRNIMAKFPNKSGMTIPVAQENAKTRSRWSHPDPKKYKCVLLDTNEMSMKEIHHAQQLRRSLYKHLTEAGLCKEEANICADARVEAYKTEILALRATSTKNRQNSRKIVAKLDMLGAGESGPLGLTKDDLMDKVSDVDKDKSEEEEVPPSADYDDWRPQPHYE